ELLRIRLGHCNILPGCFSASQVRCHPIVQQSHLLTMADRSLVAYTEAQTQGILQRETTAVVPLVTAYHQLQAEALSQAASVALIQQV
ncbi:Scr1 family TA system antitoxin-like transcriptional regulator, partial [Streptomyces albidoflavus]|uniref:Scr1 family TA system antitoxin-like transcriptional regulator n=1 Tax=Streptomyces albidoflavus TaxID=1886 RepID=UPI0033F16C48